MRVPSRSLCNLALLSLVTGASAYAQANPASEVGLPLSLAAPVFSVTANANEVPASASEAPVGMSSSFDSSAAALPDSPSAVLEGAVVAPAFYQSGKGGLAVAGTPVAPKYATTILPGQTAQPLTGGEKVAFAFRNTVSPFNFLSIVISATYSQGVNSSPHYGQGWGPYGQRIGASAARNTIQNLAGQAVFAPLFHDDPRYYVLGRDHKFVNRVVYAATRVLVTRSDSGSSRVNAPLLLGYAVAAGANNAYYPENYLDKGVFKSDRGGKQTAISYASSLGGAVLGMEVSEFLNDALGLVHLRRN